MPEQYEIETLLDIAKLEYDQIDRLCAELPSAIKKSKAMVDLMGLVGEAAGIEGAIAQFISPMTWIDDGAQDLTMTLTHEGEEIEQIVFESERAS